MSINAKLIEQDKIITDIKEATKKLKAALKMVLRPNNDACGEDGIDPKASQSGLSDIIDHHNNSLSECKEEIGEILSLIDLEF